MGRKNRRKKIAAILRKAKKRRAAEAHVLANPQTVTGQSLCTLEDFEQREKDLAVARHMKAEEVLVSEADTDKEPEVPRSWFASLLSYVW